MMASKLNSSFIIHLTFNDWSKLHIFYKKQVLPLHFCVGVYCDIKDDDTLWHNHIRVKLVCQ